jgi:hypothetical protein
MDFPVNVASFSHVYSLSSLFLLREDKGKQRDLWVLSQRQKNSASVLLRFVWRRSVLPGNQKRGRKMTVHTAKKEEIKSAGLKTRRSWNKIYQIKGLRDIKVLRIGPISASAFVSGDTILLYTSESFGTRRASSLLKYEVLHFLIHKRFHEVKELRWLAKNSIECDRTPCSKLGSPWYRTIKQLLDL